MITVVIICITLMILYIICALAYLFFKPGFIFHMMMEHPIKTLIVTKLWWYGSMFTLIGCIAYHFIEKYW